MGEAVDYPREAATKGSTRDAVHEHLKRYEQALDVSHSLRQTPDYRRGIDVRLDLNAPLVVIGQSPRLQRLHDETEQLARQGRRRMSHGSRVQSTRRLFQAEGTATVRPSGVLNRP